MKTPYMRGHMSVVVRTPEVTYFIAADATYAEVLLKERAVDGLAGDTRAYLDTLNRIAAFARSEPTVLLPSHDPLGEHRLAERIPIIESADAAQSVVARWQCSRGAGNSHLVTQSQLKRDDLFPESI